MRKVSLFFLAAATFALAGTARAGTTRWHFVTEQFAPYIAEKDGRAVGPMVVVLTELCGRLGAQCEIELLPWRRALASGTSAQVDGVFALVDHGEPREDFHVSSPVVETRYGFFARKADTVAYRTPSDLIGRNVGVYGPSASSRLLTRLALGTNAQPHLELDNATVLRKLQAGRYGTGGLALVNERVAEDLIAAESLNGLRLAGVAARPNLAYGLRRSMPAAEVERFNRALDQMCRSGRLQALLAPYRMQAPACRTP
ncbi:ABC transporter substrate-binding protein [Pelomonas sp. KK5]|uniref:substrate-binding periplasmic protein n=1 Tax=Pelomonas sp. KK5 TaxID=1855730 RepID=UPI00097C300E|nr:transporter substrate-binding domain-containing protein [Pelomonas sp. KK5]